ncbi:MAG: response regulator [Leptospirillia bacterium]
MASSRIRASDTLAEVPVLAVGAGALPEDRHKATRAGFDGYVTKPFQVTDLLDRVREVTGRV